MRYRGIHYHVLTIGISYKGTKINKNANVCHFFLYKSPLEKVAAN